MQEQKKKTETEEILKNLKDWFGETQRKKMIPTLPTLPQENQSKENLVKNEEQETVSGEALDKMLYGDICPSINLQEVLNVHKEAS